MNHKNKSIHYEEKCNHHVSCGSRPCGMPADKEEPGDGIKRENSFPSRELRHHKISSDTHIIGSYYSLDGKEWQLVRLYKNNYPKNLLVGFSSLAPRKGECVCEFSELSKSTNNVSDFRLGI